MVTQSYWKSVLQLMRINKPVGNFLLLWPTLTALWLAANGVPDVQLLLIFTLGVFIMRAAGSVINDIADRKIDPHVQRTAGRPLAARALTTRQALTVFVVLLLAACCLLIPLNHTTQLLAILAAGLAIFYPFSKRFFACPQLVLAVVWSWSILMATTAIQQTITLAAVCLFAANAFQTLAYDTMYAMVDRDDDQHLGIGSAALLFQHYDKMFIGLAQIGYLVSLIALGRVASLGGLYWASVVLAGAMLASHQWLIAERNPHACFQAFLSNHWVSFVVLLGVAASV